MSNVIKTLLVVIAALVAVIIIQLTKIIEYRGMAEQAIAAATDAIQTADELEESYEQLFDLQREACDARLEYYQREQRGNDTLELFFPSPDTGGLSPRET